MYQATEPHFQRRLSHSSPVDAFEAKPLLSISCLYGFVERHQSEMKVRTILTSAIAIVALAYLLNISNRSFAADLGGTASSQHWEWEIPQQLSDSNTEVTFEVDSTWHLVKGTTSAVDGRIWLADSHDPLSIRATVRFPVKEFVTGSESRDERMREVMDSERFPYVTLAVDSFKPHCAPETLTSAAPCSVTLGAHLSIRGNARPLSLAAVLRQESGIVTLSGSTRFLWADFGVEDPSILVAKLDPEVVISYSVRLPTVSRKKG